MASGTVNDRTVGNIFTIVDHDGPKVDEAKEEDICDLLEGKDKREDVVRDALRPAVNGVEGVGRIRAGHDPLVMGLMQGLVNERVMETPMDPVDAKIGESEEERELEDAVVREWLFSERVIEFGIASDLGDEERSGQQGHERHRTHCLHDLHWDLVLEEFRMLEGGLVPDEDVGQSCTDEIDKEAEDPTYRDELR